MLNILRTPLLTMKIYLNLTKEEAEYLKSPHTFNDGCTEADDVLRKVQKCIDEKLRQRNTKATTRYWYNRKIKSLRKVTLWQ